MDRDRSWWPTRYLLLHLQVAAEVVEVLAAQPRPPALLRQLPVLAALAVSSRKL